MPPGDVTVPARLARQLARLAVLGLAEVRRRDGGLLPAPGLADLLSELSACGRPDGTVDPANSPLAGSTPLLGSGWLTVGEASRVVRTSPRHVRRLAGSRLRARKAGRDWLIDADSAEDYAREREIAS